MARPKKSDEQPVLTAARDAFRRSGYAATSVPDLTAVIDRSVTRSGYADTER